MNCGIVQIVIHKSVASVFRTAASEILIFLPLWLRWPKFYFGQF